MMAERLKNFLRGFPVFYLWLHKIKIRAKIYKIRLFGLGYTERIITGGPIQGLRFVAARRVHYSKWFWNGTYEKETCCFLQAIIPPKGVCYDIGANLGYHALVMAEAAENGQVYAFEPIPQVCEILQRNIALNHKLNITIVSKVVTRMAGKIQLGINTFIDQAAVKFVAEDESHIMCENVDYEGITLDGFVAEGNTFPFLIKIDVEGAEVDVLQGARGVLAQYHPLVLCETHGQAAARGVYEILCEHGYDLFIVHDGVRPINSFEDMPDNMDEGHVFARPKDRNKS